MPNSLITKFPSLQLTSRHKICSTCRQKLYKLDPEECVSTTSVECSILSTASISNVPEREADAPEFSGYASTAMTSIAACNQNDEGDETNTCTSHSELEDNDDDSQIMLGDEISCSEIGADSDIEGYRSDEETTDNSNTDPMNSIVHSTQSEISDNELQIDDMSRNENDITKLNETLICYGISPVSKREALRQGKNYGLRKIRRLEGRLSASIKRTVGVDLCLSPEEDAESTIIKQLKEKFNSSLKRSEMVQILTVLPKNWPIRRIVEEFGATNFMARQAKKLVHEKGILSSPNLKPGKTLPAVTEELVLSVYHNDEISRTMPGRKDCVSVTTEDGTREHRQKRLLLCNLKEAYQHFKELHPSVKVV
eukprot:Em0004g1725a